MGDPSAFLAYGYDLGGESWKFSETDEYGLIDASKVTWYDDGEDASDFITQAERRLLAAVAGFTETWATRETRDGDGYFERESEAEARLGVKFERYSYGEYPMFVLAAKVIGVGDDEAKLLGREDLSPDLEQFLRWDRSLKAALEALSITPQQENPSWLLCAYYS